MSEYETTYNISYKQFPTDEKWSSLSYLKFAIHKKNVILYATNVIKYVSWIKTH